MRRKEAATAFFYKLVWEFKPQQTMDLYSRAIVVVSGISLFSYCTKYKAVFTVLVFFYLVILTFTKSHFLAIGNITEVHFQE